MKDLLDFLSMVVMVLVIFFAMHQIERMDAVKRPRYERRDCKTTIDPNPLSSDSTAIEMTVCKLVTVQR